MSLNRRQWLQATGAAAIASAAAAAPAEKPLANLKGEVGVTTGSFMKHLAVEPAAGKLRLLDLPKIMRDELGLKVIDLMTRTLASLDPPYLDRLRNEAEKHGCLLTNLKLNLEVEPGSPDETIRRQALDSFKQAIDAAQRLGVRWVRPTLGKMRGELKTQAASLRELIDYARPKGISVLIENNTWLSREPEAIPGLIAAVGQDLRAQPDTGNWNDAVRYAGLAKAFPLAASCDFKAYALGPDGAHAAYDLRRCFQIGWDAGFRGPWCLEHFHDDLASLLQEFVWLKDQLHKWMAEAK
jgi:hypothetical protein